MSMVYFAFGAAAVPSGGQLPGGQLAGRVLLRLLADLGLSEAAARSLLLRMRRDGWLDSERTGREARYRLAPAILAAQARVEAQLRGHRPEWTGSFNGVLYEIPEDARAYRDRLRRTAHLLGYATLRPGLLVATTDRWAELATLLPAHPAGSQLLQIQLRLGAADSREVAARLWHLDALAARYRAVLARARTLTSKAGQHPPGAAAFRAFAAATLPIYQASVDDPDLPAELLPAGWPGDQLSGALERAFRAFYRPIIGYLTGVTS
ncbi:MAG TPA: PaaX family transcriptional regulator C-terminal domain-containing protein [Streptosporangiaceae bacterium]|jgi:phenylacetic acid degradation operon negative regulatory protein|nr:PaaX family transcriptional regulator C-terminal domain-containing protein [Streptosporangiaceae bacterium]